jgi:hypothetical protein
MRIAAKCEKCSLGRALVHTTIEHARYIVRYRRCDVCHDPSKTIQMILTRNENIDCRVDVRKDNTVETNPANKEITNDTSKHD